MHYARYRWTISRLAAVWKSAIVFEFWSTLIVAVSFAPASGWLLNRLVATSGQYAVSDQDLLAFILSPLGVLFLLLNVSFVLAVWFAEQAGLLLIMSRETLGEKVAVSQVLRANLRHLLAFIRLGLCQAAGYIVAGLPFGLAIALTYRVWLWDRDLYYYLNVQPLSWWIALAVAGAMLIAYLLLATGLYIRWLFSIPALIFEHATPIGALRQSWQRTRGRIWRFGIPLAICWFVVILSSLAMTWLIRSAASQLLADTELVLSVVLPAVVGTLAVITITDFLWLIIGKTWHVMLMASFYFETNGVKPPPECICPCDEKPGTEALQTNRLAACRFCLVGRDRLRSRFS